MKLFLVGALLLLAGLAAGHGDSGEKGYIAYIGQLEHDLEDFVGEIRPVRPSTLAGFSSGGGFALRFGVGPSQALFDNYRLLSPFLGQDDEAFRGEGKNTPVVLIPGVGHIALTLNAGAIASAIDAVNQADAAEAQARR